MKKVLVFFMVVLCVALCTTVAFADVFSHSEGKALLYSNSFDGKTAAQIYSEWNGAHASTRANPVNAEGYLWSDWDTTNGVGYAFKNDYTNVRYDFDVRTSGTGAHACIALRTPTHGGSLFGGIEPTDSSVGYGVGFYLYDASHPGQVTLLIADAGSEVLKNAPMFQIDYPAGIDFTEDTKMTIFDMDNKILYYVNDQPFAAIVFDGLSNEMYSSGQVYDGTGAFLGSFQKRVKRNSNFAIVNRVSQIYLDDFSVSLPVAADEEFCDIYTETFDSSTAAQIYSRWNGAHAAARTAPVNENGELWANWDLTGGVGYSLKMPMGRNRYDFKVRNGGTRGHSVIALRTYDQAGMLYGGIAPTDVSNGRGVGFYLYDSTHPGQVTILVANDGFEKLATAPQYHIDYPEGVDFLTLTDMTIYDMYDRILFFIEGKLFAYIYFDAIDAGYFTSGSVYDANGTCLGSFSNTKIRTTSYFAFCNRDSAIYLDDFVISRPIKNTSIFDYDISNMTTVFEDDFDGKTAAQIYADWGGAHASLRKNPVENGWLMCDWDIPSGVGYAFKASLMGAIYDFDISFAASGAHDVVALRSPSNAGGLFGGIDSSDTSVGRGVGLYFYDSTNAFGTTVLFADSSQETLSATTKIQVPYRYGSVSGHHMTICDLDDRILCFVDNEPYFAIKFGGLTGENYTSGNVYDASGTSIGSFSGKKIPRCSNFAITNRASKLAIDNFKIQKGNSALKEVHFRPMSVAHGTSWARAFTNIPDQLSVEMQDGTVTFLPVTWTVDGYDPNVAGTYTLTGTFKNNIQGVNDTFTTSITVLPKTSYSGVTTLYQLGPSKTALMMGYVIKTKTGKLIVIDGGLVNDNACNGYLYSQLQQISGQSHPVVEAWFLTHMHDDHFTEFMRMGLNHAGGITVKNVYMKFFSLDWYTSHFTSADYNSSYYPDFVTAYNNLMGSGSFDARKHVEVGDTIVIDDVVFNMLYSPSGLEPCLNDTSLVFRMTVDNQTVLFYGDMHYNVIADIYGYKLKSDIVQMAHHGQGGVNQDTYQLTRPDICLWPTPNWVWENASGIYETTAVRGWMSQQGVTQHYVVGLSNTQTISLPVSTLTPYRFEYTDSKLYPVSKLTAAPLYLRVETAARDNLVYMSALYKDGRCVSVNVHSAADFPAKPALICDLSGETDLSGYSVKTYQWDGTGTIKPVGEISSINP